MAVRTSHVKSQVTTRSPNYSLSGGAELPLARIVAFLLLVLPIVALAIVSNQAFAVVLVLQLWDVASWRTKVHENLGHGSA